MCISAVPSSWPAVTNFTVILFWNTRDTWQEMFTFSCVAHPHILHTALHGSVTKKKEGQQTLQFKDQWIYFTTELKYTNIIFFPLNYSVPYICSQQAIRQELLGFPSSSLTLSLLVRKNITPMFVSQYPTKCMKWGIRTIFHHCTITLSTVKNSICI